MLAPVLHDSLASASRARLRAPKTYRVQAPKVCRDFGAAAKMLAKKFAEEDARKQEVFIAIIIDVRGHVVGTYEIARGQKSHVTIGVDDVVRAALLAAIFAQGEGYFVFHNHPSGVPSPSDADRKLSARLAKATEPFDPDLMFLGQGIVAGGRYWSSQDDRVHKVPR